jgi:CDP-4-dehydro-6-deoxyglucose reductase
MAATVTVTPDDVCICAREGETILDAVMRGGYSYRYACRRGGCTECKVQLRSGEVVYNKRIAKQILTDEERERGVCLSCRAVPVTDVEMQLPEGDSLHCVSPLMAEVAQAELARHRAEAASAPPITEPGQRQRAEPGGTTRWV